jgi:hypothetical protein
MPPGWLGRGKVRGGRWVIPTTSSRQKVRNSQRKYHGFLFEDGRLRSLMRRRLWQQWRQQCPHAGSGKSVQWTIQREQRSVGECMKSTREKKGQNKNPRCVSWGDETQAVSHEKTRQGSTPCHAKTSLEGIQKQSHVAKPRGQKIQRYEKICSSGQRIC